MGKESRYFGAPFFSPRERFLLRGQFISRSLREWYMRWRYRDRVEFGPGCQIDPRTLIVSGLGAVELGPGVIIERGVHPVVFHLEPGSRVKIEAGAWFQTWIDSITFSCKQGAEIIIGENAWFSGGLFAAAQRITVGPSTEIGCGCLILDSDFHRLDNDAPTAEPAPVTIGAHVWMPSYVTVLKGVTIGDHCVIGSGSLVTSDIPPRSFAAGRPARVLRSLGPRDAVDRRQASFSRR